MCATSPTVVCTVTSAEESSPAAVPWPRLRMAAGSHPRPLNSHVCPRKAHVLRGWSIGIACSVGTADPPPNSLVQSKHSLKPPGRSIIHNSILAAFLRGHIHRAKRLSQLSCSLIRDGSAQARPFRSPPCDLVRNDLPTTLPANHAHGRPADTTGTLPPSIWAGESARPPRQRLPRQRRPCGRSTVTSPALSTAVPRNSRPPAGPRDSRNDHVNKKRRNSN